MEDRFLNYKKKFESFLEELLLPEFRLGSHPLLFDAIQYSLTNGGKRLRPVLVLAAAEGSDLESDSLRLAAAVEYIHTYSLIHDDLPCMDNDDFRRGVPTAHKKFDEATAILAGDALNSAAFYQISRVNPRKEDPQLHSDLIAILHEGAGYAGMVSGQVWDLQSEGKQVENPENTLLTLHSQKTGALITTSILLGNRLRTDFFKTEAEMRQYGEKLGLLFQITDDILDIEGTQESLGKTPGKDERNGKLTFPSLYGLKACRDRVQDLSEDLIHLASGWKDSRSDFFRELPNSIAKREA